MMPNSTLIWILFASAYVSQAAAFQSSPLIRRHGSTLLRHSPHPTNTDSSLEKDSTITASSNVINTSFINDNNNKNTDCSTNPYSGRTCLDAHTYSWARRGLFLSSSLSSSLNKSSQAKLFLTSSLLLSIALVAASDNQNDMNEIINLRRHVLSSSSLSSSWLNHEIDSKYDIHTEIKHLQSFLLQRKRQVFLRILYIPTAMYALQPKSTNTPGKQRQRARADGKQRRDHIIEYIQNLNILGQQQEEKEKDVLSILAITLDLDDGSLKQPYGSTDTNMFPLNGHDAFNTWNPNLIYLEGGNTFWLYHCIEKGNWVQDIYQATTNYHDTDRNGYHIQYQDLQEKPFAVFIGKSAGAIVGGSIIETACWKGWDDPSIIPGMSKREDWKHVQGMKLAGTSSFFPHMSAEWETTVHSNIQDWEEDDIKSLFLLHDDDVVLVDGYHKRVILASQDS